MTQEIGDRLETVKGGVKELLQIQEAELEETDRQKLGKGLELLEKLSEQIEEEAEPEKIVDTVEKLSGEQVKLVKTISDRIEELEKKGEENKAEKEHDRRHAAIGVFGGVVRIAQQIAEEEGIETEKDFDTTVKKMKSYSSRS